MSIDTQAKRGAALGFSSMVPSLALPFPDGAINRDDQYVLLGLYPFAVPTGGEGSGTGIRIGISIGL